MDVQFSRCEIIKICGFSIHLVRVGSKVVTSLRGPLHEFAEKRLCS